MVSTASSNVINDVTNDINKVKKTLKNDTDALRGKAARVLSAVQGFVTVVREVNTQNALAAAEYSRLRPALLKAFELPDTATVDDLLKAVSQLEDVPAAPPAVPTA